MLLTGGSDATANLYSYSEKGELKLISHIDIFEKSVQCVKIVPSSYKAPVFALVGGSDGKIYGFDNVGNPLFML